MTKSQIPKIPTLLRCWDLGFGIWVLGFLYWGASIGLPSGPSGTGTRFAIGFVDFK
jgi:hypothetical protein